LRLKRAFAAKHTDNREACTAAKSEFSAANRFGELARKQVFAFVDRLSGAIAELGSLSDSPRRAETAQ
jgi:hypothetical protein